MSNFSVSHLRIGDIVDLTIETLAFGGEGIAKLRIGEKPFTVFVEETVPGDMIKARIFKKKKNFAKAYLQEIVKPSSLRSAPRCKHFGSSFKDGKHNKTKGCGGCTWQYLTYEQQLIFKERQVREAIKHLGGIEEEVVKPIIGLNDPWFYRNKMEFSFNQTDEGKLELGLHLKRRHHDVIELEECFLLAPFVGEFITEARAFFQELQSKGEIPANLVLKSLTIRQGKNTDEIMVIISSENEEKTFPEANFLQEIQQWISSFFAQNNFPLTSLYYLHYTNKKGQPTTIQEKLLQGRPTIQEKLHLENGQSLVFEISPQAFFQPNTFQAQVLYQKALEAASLSGKEVVYDLFCGTGTIGIFCAQKAQKVYGIELNASAIENAQKNARLNGITNIEFIIGDVEKKLFHLNEKPDVIIVDPPRNGLSPKTIEKIIEFAPSKIVYVSCNPTTLARDIKLLTQKYALESVQPVDMFPQTYHIENVGILKKL